MIIEPSKDEVTISKAAFSNAKFDKEMLARFILESELQISEVNKSNVHLGMGFASKGIPIDILTLLYAGENGKTFTIMIADEFLRFNHVDEEEIALGLANLDSTLAKLKRLYGLKVTTIRSSEIFRDEKFKSTVKDTRSTLLDNFNQEIIECIPVSKRHLHNAKEYPIHEIAMSCYLAKYQDIQVKLGPDREKLYDKITVNICPGLKYAYAVNALPIGTKDPKQVVHYIPSDVGSKGGGARLLLNDSGQALENKLNSISIPALPYYEQLAALCAHRLGISFSGTEGASPKVKLKAVKTALKEALFVPFHNFC